MRQQLGLGFLKKIMVLCNYTPHSKKTTHLKKEKSHGRCPALVAHHPTQAVGELMQLGPHLQQFSVSFK
jgi:hypothetical protein